MTSSDLTLSKNIALILFVHLFSVAHEAIRRYKTLCERFRREMIKQSSIPNFTSTWCLFDKFAALKDAQSSDERKLRIKEEPALENEVIDYAALAAAATVATSSSIQTPKAQKRKRKSQSSTSISDFNGTMAMTNGNGALEIDHNGIDLKIPHIDRIFHNQSIDEDQDTNESMHVEPTFIGGSTDLSADTVAAFCSFLEANLKQMTTDRSDDLIEEISMLLFRRKREYKQKDRSHEEKTTNSAFAAQPPQSSPSSQTPSSQPINEFTT